MYYVYVLTNWNDTVMYIGVTNDLVRRLDEHRRGVGADFTQRYRVYKLVYFETVEDIRVAIDREKQLKKWSRVKKNALVAKKNPEWRDLSGVIMAG